MNEEIIKRHNAVVKDPRDKVIHVGDFTLEKNARPYIARLNGLHFFIRGSHDRWLTDANDIWRTKIGEQTLVACHYAMRVWPLSHYGSWSVYGHSRGKLPAEIECPHCHKKIPTGKQYDVGVDNNNFAPVSLEQLKVVMAALPDNPNLLKRGDKDDQGGTQEEAPGTPQGPG